MKFLVWPIFKSEYNNSRFKVENFYPKFDIISITKLFFNDYKIIKDLRLSANHKVHVKKPSWDAMGNNILMNDYETIIQFLGHE